MNPLLYKAHPLLFLTVDLLANPAAHPWREAGRLALVYAGLNLVWTPWLWWGVKKAAGFAPSIPLAYALALPALLCYQAPMLTVLGDVLAHAFHFADRFILVFCVFVAVQMLGALYAVAIRRPDGGGPIGLADGMAVSLSMWLLSLPTSMALLGLDAAVWKAVGPAP
jgi:hypothetical protein